MKRLAALLLTLVMILSLCACGAEKTKPAPAEENKLVVDTCILLEADEAMINNYSLLAVNPEAPFKDADGNPVEGVQINTAGAAALINWLLSEEGQSLAADYGMSTYSI